MDEETKKSVEEMCKFIISRPLPKPPTGFWPPVLLRERFESYDRLRESSIRIKELAREYLDQR